MKNKCDSLEEKIIEFVYGEAEPGTEEEIKAHLDSCEGCKRKVAGYKKVAERAGSIKVDFSDDIWRMQRESIIRRVRKEKDAGVLGWLGKAVRGLFEARKLSFALAVLLLIAVGAGIQNYKKNEMLARDKAITEKFELYENLEILERLDFYAEVSQKGVL